MALALEHPRRRHMHDGDLRRKHPVNEYWISTTAGLVVFSAPPDPPYPPRCCYPYLTQRLCFCIMLKIVVLRLPPCKLPTFELQRQPPERMRRHASSWDVPSWDPAVIAFCFLARGVSPARLIYQCSFPAFVWFRGRLSELRARC